MGVMDLFRLDGRVALVTGGSRGLGLQMARALVDEVATQLGDIDILVNNAGATWGAPAEAYPDEAWHKVMNLNVNAPFFLAREVGRRCMIPRRCPRAACCAGISG